MKQLAQLGRPLAACALAATLFACSPAEDEAAAPDPTLVSTMAGPLQGVEVDGVYEFRGVPYAKPPVGPLRFQGPQTLETSELTTLATQYGQPCVQMRAGAGAASYPPLVQAAMSEAFAPPENVNPEGEENCLVLNVYTQTTGADAGANRPVMVWLHGGGFSYGQAALNIYQGHNLAKNHDVVFVGVNHRLNIFGFLGLDAAGIPGFENSANAGMLDIVAALEWVNANIDQFGGDPGNVTIFGQSGGGAKVAALLAMPQAEGLFQRAIVQSGAGTRVGETADAEQAGLDFLAATGIPASTASELIPTLTTQDILAAANDIGTRAFRPSIDGANIPRHPFAPDAAPTSANVPVMVGFTSDEQTLYNVGNPEWLNTTEEQLLDAAERVAPGNGQALIDSYREIYPDQSPAYILMQVTGTTRQIQGAAQLAGTHAALPAPTYAYVFTHPLPPQDFVLKSPHTAEIPYIMDNVRKAPLFAGATDTDFAVEDMMSNIWVNFARTGNPNTEGLPEWPQYNAERRPTMFLGAESHVVEKPFQTALDLAAD